MCRLTLREHSVSRALENYGYHNEQSLFFSPTDAEENCFKSNVNIYVKTVPTCFSAVTPSSGSALFELAKLTVVKTV